MAEAVNARGPRWVLLAYLSGMILLAAGVTEFYLAAADQRANLAKFFNSDTLFPEGLYRDCVVDGHHWSTFRFPTAPFWFPDVALYFACRAATGAPSPAVALFAAAQFSLLLLAIRSLTRAVAPAGDRALADVSVLAAGAAFLAVNAEGLFGKYHLLLPYLVQLHVGSLTCCVFALALTARILAAPGWGLGAGVRAAALFATLALAVASDRVAVMWFSAPALLALAAFGALAWARERRWAPLIRAAAPAVVVGAGTAAGVLLHRSLVPREFDPIGGYTRFTAEDARSGLGALAGEWGGLLRSGDLAAVSLAAFCLGSLAAAGGLAWRLHRADAAGRSRAFVAGFYLVMAAATVGGVASAGLVALFADNFKFMLPVYLIPALGWGLWAVVAASASPWPWARPAAAGLCLALAAVPVARAACEGRNLDRAVLDYYPPETRLLDEAAERYGVRVGLAGHWDAHVHHLMSRRGVTVLAAVNSDTHPSGFVAQHHLSSSARWLSADDPTRIRNDFAFFIVDLMNLDRSYAFAEERLLSRYGEPAAVVGLGAKEMWVYNRPSDQPFREMIACNPGVTNLTATSPPRERFRYPAVALQRPSLVAFGPYLPVRPGRYRVTLTYSATSEGWWETQLVGPSSEENTKQGALPVGEQVPATVELNVPSAASGLSLCVRVFSLEAGGVTIHNLDVERPADSDPPLPPRAVPPSDYRLINSWATCSPGECLHYPASGLPGTARRQGPTAGSSPGRRPRGASSTALT